MRYKFTNSAAKLLVSILMFNLGFLPSASTTLLGELQRFQVSNSYQWPYNLVGQINDFCTGTLIAPNKVLTAAHCLFDFETQTFMPATKFNMARNGILNPGLSLDIKSISPHPLYMLTGSSQYDVGIITLTTSLNLNKFMPINFNPDGWALNPKNLSFEKIGTIIGYPGDKLVGTMWFVACNFERRISDFYRPHYTCDTFGGMSGSPIIVSENSESYIVGVHTNGGKKNSGLFLLGEIFEFISKEVVKN